MRKFIMSLTTVASLSLAAVPVLGLTQAANAAERVARVAYGDLNLVNPSQAKIFKARVDAASEDMCRAKLRSGDLSGMTYRGCVVAFQREVDRQLPTAQRANLKVAARGEAIEVAAK